MIPQFESIPERNRLVVRQCEHRRSEILYDLPHRGIRNWRRSLCRRKFGDMAGDRRPLGMGLRNAISSIAWIGRASVSRLVTGRAVEARPPIRIIGSGCNHAGYGCRPTGDDCASTIVGANLRERFARRGLLPAAILRNWHA